MTNVPASVPEPNYRVITWSVIVIALSVVFTFLPQPGRIDVVTARNITTLGYHTVPPHTLVDRVADFTREHPDAFIMTVRDTRPQLITPNINGADNDVTLWCIDSRRESTRQVAEAVDNSCYKEENDTMTIAIYGGRFRSMSFISKTTDVIEAAVIHQWGTNDFVELPETFAQFHRVEISPQAGAPNLSRATSLRNTFQHVKDFRGDVSMWDVSQVQDFSGLFHDSGFHGDISRWNPKNATTMNMMFADAEQFDTDISRWDISRVISMHNIFDKTGLSPTHATAILTHWAANLPTDVVLGSNTIYYCGKPEAIKILKTKIAKNLGGVAQAPDCDPPRVKVVEKIAPKQPSYPATVVRLRSDKTLRRWGDECAAVPHTATESKELECRITTPGEHLVWVKDYYNNTATIPVAVYNTP